MRHTIKNENGIKILCRDGHPLICPFKPSLVLPGQMAGQLTIHREPCGSQCPHFTESLIENNGLSTDDQKNQHHVFLSCGCTNEFLITTDEPTKPEPGKLIKL